MTPIIGIIASSTSGASALGNFESISTQTLGSSQATITFSSIPSTYTHLQLRIISRSTNTSFQQIGFSMRFNGDTAANYSAHQLYGDRSVAGASAPGVSATSMLLGQESSSINNPSNLSFGATIIDILDYTNTNKYKTVRSLTGSDITTAGTIALRSGNWRSTSAVTSITFFETSSFTANSSFALYGIK